MGFPAPADRAKLRGPADRVKFRLANPRDVKALEPVIGPPLANPPREKPACPIREIAAPRTEGATAPDRAETAATTSSEAATSAVPAEPSPARLGSPYRNGKRKEESVAIEATRKYFGMATSRCRGPVGYRAHSLEPPAAAMVAVPGGRNLRLPRLRAPAAWQQTVERQYWNRQLALGLIRRHANCLFQTSKLCCC